MMFFKRYIYFFVPVLAQYAYEILHTFWKRLTIFKSQKDFLKQILFLFGALMQYKTF